MLLRTPFIDMCPTKSSKTIFIVALSSIIYKSRKNVDCLLAAVRSLKCWLVAGDYEPTKAFGCT